MSIPVYQPYDIVYYDKDGNKLEDVEIRWVPSKDKDKPSYCAGTETIKVDWEKLTEYATELDTRRKR